MGIPDHITCLLRNLYGGQEATARPRNNYVKFKNKIKLKKKKEKKRNNDCFKIGKEYIKAIYCHPAYLTYMHHAKCWAG